MIDVRFECKDAIKKLNFIEKQQLPYAMSRAINQTAKDVQAAEVKEMERVLDNPTPYIKRGVFINNSTKKDLRATIYLNDKANKGTPVAKILEAQIGGGERKHKPLELWFINKGCMSSSKYIVPERGMKLDRYGNVSNARVKAILNVLGGNPLDSDINKEYFVIKNVGVYQRKGRKTRRVEPILIFVDTPRYKERYDFVGTGLKEARRVMVTNFNKAMAEAVRTAR